MDEATFLDHIIKWKAMPDKVIDVRDFQLVKARPYPWELKANALRSLYMEATEQQRWQLPYLISEPDCYSAAEVACELYLNATPKQRENLINSPLCGCAVFGLHVLIRHIIPNSNDSAWLRMALGAVALLDACDDEHGEPTSWLAFLYEKAKEVEIDPVPHFVEAAEGAREDTAKSILDFLKRDEAEIKKLVQSMVFQHE